MSRLAPTRLGPIEWAEVGEGRPILFLHGAPGGVDQGLFFAQRLSDPGLRVLSISRPGYLRTPLAVGRSVAEQADALAALLDAIGETRVTVVAHSTGGAIAVDFAARHSDRCAALVLASTVSHRLPGRRALPWGLALVEPFLRAAEGPSRGSLRLLERVERDLARLSRARMPASLSALPALTQTLFPAALRGPGLRNDLEILLNLETPPFEAVRCPVLLLHGTRDLVIPIGHGRMAARSLEAARWRPVRGGHHFFLFAMGDAERDELRAFLRDPDSSS